MTQYPHQLQTVEDYILCDLCSFLKIMRPKLSVQKQNQMRLWVISVICKGDLKQRGMWGWEGKGKSMRIDIDKERAEIGYGIRIECFLFNPKMDQIAYNTRILIQLYFSLLQKGICYYIYTVFLADPATHRGLFMKMISGYLIREGQPKNM